MDAKGTLGQTQQDMGKKTVHKRSEAKVLQFWAVALAVWTAKAGGIPPQPAARVLPRKLGEKGRKKNRRNPKVFRT